MNHIEAMKQALEALEANQPVNYCMNNNGEKFPMMQEDPFRFERNTKAITALRQAIEQAEKQEPVAWRWKERINGDFDSWVISAFEPPPYAIEKQPLYTAPPQRQPLPAQSPCEMTPAERKMFRLGWLECEAAHGIKENT